MSLSPNKRKPFDKKSVINQSNGNLSRQKNPQKQQIKSLDHLAPPTRGHIQGFFCDLAQQEAS